MRYKSLRYEPLVNSIKRFRKGGHLLSEKAETNEVLSEFQWGFSVPNFKEKFAFIHQVPIE